MTKYKPFAIEHGVEFLLPPSTALHFAHDLQKINVAIMGVDGWFYVHQDKGWIVQDLDVDLSIDEEILQQKNAVEKSVAIVSRFIRKQLPKRTEFVSFTLDTPLGEAPPNVGGGSAGRDLLPNAPSLPSILNKRATCTEKCPPRNEKERPARLTPLLVRDR